MRSLAKAPTDWLEDELDRHLFRSDRSLAKMLGWTTYHTLRSRGSKAGYPDRTCVRERVLFAELKTEKGKPTDAQVEWLDKLANAGGEVYLWRPSDLDEIGKVLGGRWTFQLHPDPRGPKRLESPASDLSPGSMWMGYGLGRRDGR